jgi:hypothetical protein
MRLAGSAELPAEEEESEQGAYRNRRRHVAVDVVVG